jgi:hypothetical protein
VLVIAAAALVAIVVAGVVADGLLRARIESELASANSPITLTLASQPVLWGFLTGTTHVDAHIDADQMRQAISAKAGVDVGEVTISGGAIHATLDGGPVTALLGGDVALELSPNAVDGELSVAVSGISVGGQERTGAALADRLGPFSIDPAEVMDCAAASSVTVDDARVQGDELVVSLSVPRETAGEMAGEMASCG